MDYQPGIVARAPGADALLARMARVIAQARGLGIHVGYVRVAFEDADYDRIPPSNKGFSALAGARPMNAADPATAVHPAVAPEPGDVVVRKTRVGAFSTTDLDAQLRGRGVDTLLLAGISTSGVVLSTLRDAADRDYRLFVIADCCADPDPQVHEVLTAKVFPRQADVITSNDFAARDGQ
ncbi:MAG: cysteine hydrolase [Gemmatimonadetes bacterium]|nr:cysteine hydrolase [Gemmatimonadota bacterium]